VLTAWGSDVYLSEDAERNRGDFAVRKADCVLALSEHMRRELIARGAPEDRLRLVDLGVDLDRFRPAVDAEQERARGELGLPPGPVILSMRAPAGLYNLDVVLEAFRTVRSRARDAMLVVVRGDARPAPRVAALLNRLGTSDGVWDVGYVSHAEMPKYLRAATVAVSVPNSDGSPSSVWEALAAGVPIVVSELPQLAERLGRNGGAKLVPPRRREPLAAALIELIENVPYRLQMASDARAWAEANVGEREQIERLGCAYEATAQRPVRDPFPQSSPLLPRADRASGVARGPGPS
jgi:glycosyltransferase involved in cell wall biosynthesis